VANSSGLSISHIGHSMLPDSNRPLYLRHILHVPGISKHLLSIQHLAHDNNVFVELHPSFFCINVRQLGESCYAVEVVTVSTWCHAQYRLCLYQVVLLCLVSPRLPICGTAGLAILHQASLNQSLCQIIGMCA
jgi:hypothetical protein